jgi:sulfatase modifying factor 1
LIFKFQYQSVLLFLSKKLKIQRPMHALPLRLATLLLSLAFCSQPFTFSLKTSYLYPMILIEGGIFEMGDLFGEGTSDETRHTVTVKSFLLAKYELTFQEYDAFCEATKQEKPSDAGWGRDMRPAIYVSWFDAVEYCNWRSRQEGLTPAYTIDGEKVTCNWSANGYRLPTEAEWEYAARQKGQKVRFGTGKDIADPEEINFYGKENAKELYSMVGEYRGKTVPAGSLNSPNSLGLHDMSGNVREWCWDLYGPDSGSDRVVRGGSWSFNPVGVRAAGRYSNSPGNRYNTVGFRLARTF